MMDDHHRQDDASWDARSVQQRMLDRGWTLADLEEAAALQAYLRQDENCRQAIAEYDAVRRALSPDQADAGDEVETSDWNGDADAEPTDGWTAFEARLSERVRTLNRPTERRRWLGWTLQMAAAVVLAALAGGVGYLVGGGAEDRPTIAGETPQLVEAAPSRYLPDEVEQQVGVFSEVSEVFDRRAGWVAFANGRSELGLASGQVVEAERLLLLRLSLAQAGTMVSQADVVIVPGQRATLALPLADGRTLHYRLHVGEQRPARLGLLAEMEAPDGLGETLAALATNLDVQPGQVIAAGSMATTTGGYELTLGFREVERKANPAAERDMPW